MWCADTIFFYADDFWARRVGMIEVGFLTLVLLQNLNYRLDMTWSFGIKHILE